MQKPPDDHRAERVSKGDSGQRLADPAQRQVSEQPDQHKVKGAFEAGSLLTDKYRVIEQIGAGGMGIVYRVEQIYLQREFALKTLVAQDAEQKNWRRFQAEAKALAKLDHPSIVKIHDFGMLENEQPFLVMDLARGTTLSDRLKTAGVLSVDEAIQIFTKTSLALAHAHEQGIVHRDLKPGNIMLSKDPDGNWSVKILDFGLAKLLNQTFEEGQPMTKTGEIFGTPFYMSPEQCLGKPIDHRSDIYSLGCVLFEALTGTPPLSGSSTVATLMMHHSEAPPSLREASLGGQYPPSLEAAVQRMLAKDPDARYQSFADVAGALMRLQLDSQQHIEGTVKPARAKKRAGLGLAPFAILTAALVLAAIAVCAWFMFERAPADKAVQQHTLPQSGAFFSKRLPNGTVEFDFPEDLSIGRIHVHDVTEEVPARGKIVLPRGHVIFEPNSYCIANPRFFRQFRPDDLGELRFMRSSGVTDDELVFCDHLTGLINFSAADQEISDRGLAHIGNLSSIKKMNLSRTKTTGKGIAQSMKNLRSIAVLKVGEVRGIRDLIKALKGSTELEELTAETTEINDDDLALIAQIPSLTRLSISDHSGVTDKGIKYLTKLKNLKELTALTCNITPKCLPYLDAIPKLTKIKIASPNSAAFFSPDDQLAIRQIEANHMRQQMERDR